MYVAAVFKYCTEFLLKWLKQRLNLVFLHYASVGLIVKFTVENCDCACQVEQLKHCADLLLQHCRHFLTRIDRLAMLSLQDPPSSYVGMNSHLAFFFWLMLEATSAWLLYVVASVLNEASTLYSGSLLYAEMWPGDGNVFFWYWFLVLAVCS